MRKIIFLLFIVFFCLTASCAFAHQPQIIYFQPGDINITNPEISRAFYDELKGEPRNYFIDSEKDFELYVNILIPLVPGEPERDKDYLPSVSITPLSDSAKSAQVFNGMDGFFLDGGSWDWKDYYETYGRDYYLKGPEFSEQVPAGKYKIEVFSKDNLGKYVLAVGKTESFDAKSILNIYWQIPLLKVMFFKTSVLQFFFTPFGIAGVGAIGGLLLLIALINYFVALIKEAIKHNLAKTLLLASSFPEMKDEIIKLLQKPAYDVTVAFITTASKPEENLDYLKKDWLIMKEEMGFNIEEIDIEGKTESQVLKLLELKDIIFVEGGNTYYLLNAMRGCNFEKVIRKLLKEGKVYVGASAGSIVAGRTIKTAGWQHDKNFVDLKDLRGLNLVPFDIFVHYQPEHAEIIKQKIKNPKKRAKKFRILRDGQALLVQGKEIMLIGDGEAVIV